jgi:predicted nuclease of predicted toxin-antitoxin system
VIKLVVDVSLSPAWVDVFTQHGLPALHWSAIGDPRAKDRTVMDWARQNQHVVFTHDLDFGTLLALTRATGPSVVQARAHDVLPEHLESVVVDAIQRYQNELEQGAIVTVDELRAKVRVLPIGSTNRNV